MKDTYKFTIKHPPIDEKDVVNKEYCDSSLISASNKIDILCENITELRKGYNQLTLEIDNNKFNQKITNIHLDDMFNTALKEFKEVNQKTNPFIDEVLIKNKKTIVQYKIAILLESKFVDNKEQARLEMHYDLNHEDIMTEIES